MSLIAIVDYSHEHQSRFESLNRQWIEKYFVMEERDIFTLTRPEEAILAPGGAILMALYDGQVAGTVALRKVNEQCFEFTKMAVDEHFRRKGIAEALTNAAFEKAKQLGADRVILYSESSLISALALYSKMGFHHLLVEEGIYRRADVKMEKMLNLSPSSGDSPDIRILRASAAHAPAIAGIGWKAFPDAFGHLFARIDELQEYLENTYTAARIRASLQKENNVFFIALANEQPVGFVKLKRNSLNDQIESLSQTELQKIYVLSAFHGSGAGQKLMDAAIEFAVSEGSAHLWLDTHVDNGRGVRFYERNGFRIIGKHHFTIGIQTFEYHLMDLQIPSGEAVKDPALTSSIPRTSLPGTTGIQQFHHNI